MAEARPLNLLVCTLERVEAGDTFFNGTPLHVTVQPWFMIPENSKDDLRLALVQYATTQPPFTITGGERALFGPNNDLPVTKISEGVARLTALHLTTLGLINKMGGTVSSSWIQDKYVPHVSDRLQEERSLHPEESVVLRALQLVRRELSGGKRVIESVFEFNGGDE